MAAKNGNPFAAYDMTKMFEGFDPAKFADEFAKIAGQAKMPSFDMQVVVDAQRKNIEALTASNQLVVEGAQAVAKRQAEIAQTAFDAATTVAEQFGNAKTPADIAAKQFDIAKAAIEGALANTKELSVLVAKSNEEAIAPITARVVEQIDEIKAAAVNATK